MRRIGAVSRWEMFPVEHRVVQQTPEWLLSLPVSVDAQPIDSILDDMIQLDLGIEWIVMTPLVIQDDLSTEFRTQLTVDLRGRFEGTPWNIKWNGTKMTSEPGYHLMPELISLEECVLSLTEVALQQVSLPHFDLRLSAAFPDAMIVPPYEVEETE